MRAVSLLRLTCADSASQGGRQGRDAVLHGPELLLRALATGDAQGERPADARKGQKGEPRGRPQLAERVWWSWGVAERYWRPLAGTDGTVRREWDVNKTLARLFINHRQRHLSSAAGHFAYAKQKIFFSSHPLSLIPSSSVVH